MQLSLAQKRGAYHLYFWQGEMRADEDESKQKWIIKWKVMSEEQIRRDSRLASRFARLHWRRCKKKTWTAATLQTTSFTTTRDYPFTSHSKRGSPSLFTSLPCITSTSGLWNSSFSLPGSKFELLKALSSYYFQKEHEFAFWEAQQ